MFTRQSFEEYREKLEARNKALLQENENLAKLLLARDAEVCLSIETAILLRALT